MIETRKLQSVIGVVMFCAYGLALCSEPNIPETGVKLEIDNENPVSWVDSRRNMAEGPLEPTHVAVLYIRESSGHLPDGRQGSSKILKTAAAKSLSERQRKFLDVADSIVNFNNRRIKNHARVFLYATSVDDTKKMVRAYLEAANYEANSKMQFWKNQLQEYKVKAVDYRKELPGIEAELETITVDYEIVKKKTHSLSSDSDAAKESKVTILKMDEILDSLTIEITGIEAKLSAVERIKSQKKVKSAEGLAKLEEIKSEQTVELAGALARKKAATDIRRQEEEFYSLHQKKKDLEIKVFKLKENLSNAENDIKRWEGYLADPKPDMLPPQLYQNKVTIHPVKIGIYDSPG